jgi:hypothetical protein
VPKNMLNVHCRCILLAANFLLQFICALLALLQPAGAGQSLQCMLEVQVLMPKAPSRRSGSANSWVTVWQCQVLFTDDAARIRELQVSMCYAALGSP